MRRIGKQSQKIVLTEVELELMKIIWSHGEASVNDVISELPKDRNLAYTSVSTIIRILEKKQILKSTKQGRSHIYTPLITKAKYEKESIKDILKNVFSDTPTALISALLLTKKMTEEELTKIQDMIDQKRGQS